MKERLVLVRLRTLLQSGLIVTAMLGLAGFVGYTLMGIVGCMVAVVVAVGGSMLAPRFSPAVMLKMTGAVPLNHRQAPELVGMVSTLAKRAGLERIPPLYYMPTRQVNAFTTGSRDNPVIVVSEGLVRYLNNAEIMGVLAHEIGHIHNNDLGILTLVEGMRKTTGAFSRVGFFLLILNLPLMFLHGPMIPLLPVVLLIAAPALSALFQLALSRTREFAADFEAVNLMGSPEPLARALQKIEHNFQSPWERLLGIRLSDAVPNMLRTHPKSIERIDRLRSLRARQPIDIPVEAVREVRKAESAQIFVDSLLEILQSRPRPRSRHWWHVT